MLPICAKNALRLMPKTLSDVARCCQRCHGSEAQILVGSSGGQWGGTIRGSENRRLNRALPLAATLRIDDR
jgi:hypothetical protein